jgi:hypothetical protein
MHVLFTLHSKLAAQWVEDKHDLPSPHLVQVEFPPQSTSLSPTSLIPLAHTSQLVTGEGMLHVSTWRSDDNGGHARPCPEANVKISTMLQNTILIVAKESIQSKPQSLTV